MGIMDRIFGNTDIGEEKVLEAAERDELQAPNFEPPKEPETPPAGYVGRNVVDFNAALSNREGAMGRGTGTITKSKITTIKPKDYSDAQTIANCLRDKIPVVINFEDTETEEAKRVIDFISGTTYALNGAIKKVSQNVFICAPDNVTVTYTDEEKKSLLD